MPFYQQGDIVMIADEDETSDNGTVALLSEIFGGEALVMMEGREDCQETVPLSRVEPFYRTSMKCAH